MRFRQFIFFSVLTIICLSVGCRKIPKFSETPKISFRYIAATPYYNADQPISNQDEGEPTADSVVIAIHIEDGNGDIGESPENRSDATINFFADLYRKTNGVFQPVPTLGVTYNGHTPLLLPTTTPGPIEVDMDYKINFNYGFLPNSNDTIKFFIKIKDRAGNISNTIETEPVVLHKTPL